MENWLDRARAPGLTTPEESTTRPSVAQWPLHNPFQRDGSDDQVSE